MCVYCMVGDFPWKYDPPFVPSQPIPFLPNPLVPPADVKPWGIERLEEFHDLLRRVKELEDRLGCPCEPSKADHLKIIADRIKELREMG